MPLRELIEQMLDLTGKNTARLRELLLGGALVRGSSRYRWERLEAAPEELARLLDSFPDADPSRPFAPERCTGVVLRGPSLAAALSRDALGRRRLLRRRSFWDALLEAAREGGLEYAGYCYRERADRYLLKLSHPAALRLREHASLLRYSALERRIQCATLRSVEFFAARPTPALQDQAAEE